VRRFMRWLDDLLFQAKTLMKLCSNETQQKLDLSVQAGT
jgi:hypothetical protein